MRIDVRGRTRCSILADLDRRIIRLAVPALGALAADPLVSLVDTYFVGRLGTDALGALGVNAAVFSLAFITFNVFQYGLTPLVAQAEGSGNRPRSVGLIQQAIRWAAALGVVVGLLLLVIGQPILRLMQASEALIPDALIYLQTRAWAAPAILVVLVGHGAYRGLHDTITPLKVTLGLNVVNLILDPLLIFGFDLGIRGAALATVAAQWIGALWFLALLRRNVLSGPGEAVEGRLLARVGRDVTIRTFALVGALTVGTAAAARLGDATVAAHQIVSQLFILLALITDALAIAAQAMIGSTVGAGGEGGDVAGINRRLWSWGLAVGVALGVAVVLLRPALSLFSDDPVVLDQARQALWVLAALQPIGALVFVGDGIYLGAGRFSFLASSTVAAAVAAVAVFAIVVSVNGTLWAVWLGISTMIVVRGLAMIRDQRRGFVTAG